VAVVEEVVELGEVLPVVVAVVEEEDKEVVEVPVEELGGVVAAVVHRKVLSPVVLVVAEVE
jgi:hypothetical protein